MREKNETGREGERDVVWPLDPARPECSTFCVCQYILLCLCTLKICIFHPQPKRIPTNMLTLRVIMRTK